MALRNDHEAPDKVQELCAILRLMRHGITVPWMVGSEKTAPSNFTWLRKSKHRGDRNQVHGASGLRGLAQWRGLFASKSFNHSTIQKKRLNLTRRRYNILKVVVQPMWGKTWRDRYTGMWWGGEIQIFALDYRGWWRRRWDKAGVRIISCLITLTFRFRLGVSNQVILFYT